MKKSINFKEISEKLGVTVVDTPAMIVSGTWTRNGDIENIEARAGYYTPIFQGVNVNPELPSVVIGEDDDETEANWKTKIEQIFPNVKISLKID